MHGQGKYLEQETVESPIVYIEGTWENGELQKSTKKVEGTKELIDLMYVTSFPAGGKVKKMLDQTNNK